MNRKHVLTQVVSVVLMALFAIPQHTRSQSNNSSQALSSLVKAAKERDKKLAKREKEVEKQERTLVTEIREARIKNLSEEAAAYRRELDALVMLDDSIGRQREVIQEIYELEKDKNPNDSKTFDRSWTFRMRVTKFTGFIDQANRVGVQAQVRLGVAESKGLDREGIALIRREVVAYQQVFAALDEEEEMLDGYLAVFSGSSVKEFQKRDQEALEASRSKFRRLERERERARDYTAKLILAVGVVAALTTILKSPDSTEEERARATESMKMYNDQARTTCAFRGGTFFEGGPYTIGVCSK